MRIETTKGKKAAQPKDWQCQECGTRMTLKRAERAMSDANGCPKCGGSDIDMVALHTKDADCKIDPLSLCCTVCGVDHSGECHQCGGHTDHGDGR